MVLTNPEYEALAPELVEKASEEVKAHLESIVTEAAREGVGSTMLMRLGDRPDVEIVAAADEINADLIVMGQQGRRGLARMMVGDATIRVIRFGDLQRALSSGSSRHVARNAFVSEPMDRASPMPLPYVQPRSPTVAWPRSPLFPRWSQP